VILGPVIDQLNLNAEWGRKYFAGETLPTAQTLAILKQRLMLAPVRNTKLIAITVFSDDRNEAAKIANAVAESYRDYRAANAVKTDPQTPNLTLVQITDTATPGRSPVRPNKPLNLALGALAGIFLGLLAGGVAEFFRGQTGTARRN
jgi:capsular polysaccharide biosynthesis protein